MKYNFKFIKKFEYIFVKINQNKYFKYIFYE